MTMATISPWQWALLLAFIQYNNSWAEPNLPSIGCVGKNCYYIVTSARSWPDARNSCRSHDGTYLAQIPNNETRRFLHKAMTSQNPPISSMWFGGQEVIHDTWRWLNSRGFTGDIHEFNNGDNEPFCGVINTKRLEGSICTQHKRYICIRSGELSSSSNFISRPEMRFKLTWFQARDDCMSRGMDLATVTSNSTYLLELLISGTADNFWIGLVKSGFVWEHDGKEIKHLQFKANAPDRRSELCLELTDSGDYNDLTCNKTRPFICQWVNETNTATSKQKFSQSVLFIGVSTGICALLIIVGIVVSIVLCRTRPKNHSRPPDLSLSTYDVFYSNQSTIVNLKKNQDKGSCDVTNQFSYLPSDELTADGQRMYQNLPKELPHYNDTN